MRQFSHSPSHRYQLAASVFRLAAWCTMLLPMTLTGCGLFSGSQVKQLQAENDKLVSEYRTLRDRAAQQAEKIALLEARNSEAEKMLARAGQSLPGRPAQIASRPNAAAPPYTPPSSSTLPDATSEATPKWRPTKRQ